MRNIIWFIALFLLLLVQGGILLPLRMAPVNLILIIVAMAVVLSDFNQGLVITLVGGLLLDFVSGSPDGLVSMSLLAVFLVMRFVESEILSREPNRFILAVSVAASTVLYFCVFLAVDRLFGFFNLTPKPEVGFILSVQLPLTLMWNLIFAYPIFKFYSLTQNLASKLPHHEEPIRS
jgi:cell shape-determining protein MreD